MYFCKKKVISIFKRKHYLPDCIPSNFTDIHSHVLPGIDDGAKTLEDTVYLIENMISFGFKKIITTPHTIQNIWNNTPQSITTSLEYVKKNVGQLTNNIDLKAASEYFLDDYFISLLEKKKLLTLKDNYVLVEMSYINPPIQLFDFIFQLQLSGYKPILAHPERYLFYHANFSAYQKLKQQGCLFQVNLLSSTGYYGKHVAKTLDKLLEHKMVDFVGSDFHHKKHIEAFTKPIIIKHIDALKNASSKNCFF
ncbi:MAG TPA: histidinol phosphatase [Flavobacterium sp.]|nr:histidinol phosphatase [Flavobacterium sp.]